MTIQFTKDWTGKDARGRERSFRTGEIIKDSHFPSLNVAVLVRDGFADDISPDKDAKPARTKKAAKASEKPAK